MKLVQGRMRGTAFLFPSSFFLITRSFFQANHCFLIEELGYDCGLTALRQQLQQETGEEREEEETREDDRTSTSCEASEQLSMLSQNVWMELIPLCVGIPILLSSTDL